MLDDYLIFWADIQVAHQSIMRGLNLQYQLLDVLTLTLLLEILLHHVLLLLLFLLDQPLRIVLNITCVRIAADILKLEDLLVIVVFMCFIVYGED